jgi:signal transduction histidine kinase
LAQARDVSTSDLSTSDLSTRDLSTRDGNEDAPDASASVQVSVIDSGRGLPAGGSQELFQAFHSTKPQGMGLGLAIAQTIIESHGGKLWATEAAGGGAAFHFTLKRAA